MDKREIKFRVWDKVDSMFMFNLEDLITNKIEFTSDCPVMQFTGLKDKNGKNELYEGDILSLHGNKIGNIYENEDLLKEETNLLIERMGTQKWTPTEQEAYKRGCKYA